MLNTETLQLFKTLTELPGAPGDERNIRKFMRSELEKYSDEIIQDNLGGIFGVRKSEQENAPKILVAGHMDEVSFMVTNITENVDTTLLSRIPFLIVLFVHNEILPLSLFICCYGLCAGQTLLSLTRQHLYSK